MRYSGPRAAAEIGPISLNNSHVLSEKALIIRHTLILCTSDGGQKKPLPVNFQTPPIIRVGAEVVASGVGV